MQSGINFRRSEASKIFKTTFQTVSVKFESLNFLAVFPMLRRVEYEVERKYTLPKLFYHKFLADSQKHLNEIFFCLTKTLGTICLDRRSHIVILSVLVKFQRARSSALRCSELRFCYLTNVLRVFCR